ncbi:MAG: hypothetical protein HKN26_14745, partial [Acidimicrobiales bacterium]|nr:hypothetical protein [Acidimicrobiales bacterium]
FYPGRDLTQIPQILMEEAVIASRDFIVEGEFTPIVTSNDRVVAELEATPPLLGFIGTTTKPSGSTLLRIGPDTDPLLATWQVGLGRATSWTSDASQRWSQLWQDWDGYVDFWSTVVQDTFPTGDGGNVRARAADGVLTVTIEGEDVFPEGSEAVARVSGPDGETQEVPLTRVAGDRYVGEITIEDAGTYAVGGSISQPDGTTITGTSLANLSFSSEYIPGDPDPERLQLLSDITGGRGDIEPAMAFDQGDLEAGVSRTPLAPWLLLAAALLWPLAVMLSRLNLRTSAVGHNAGRLFDSIRDRLPARPGREKPERPDRPRPKRAKIVEEPPDVAEPPATVGRLLDRKRSSRGGPGSDDPTGSDGARGA